MSSDHVKIIIVGDATVGKTCLVHCFGQNTFPTAYLPTISDNYVGHLELDGALVDFTVWDTAG